MSPDIDLNDPRFDDALEVINQQNIPKDDREREAGEILEEMLLEDFGDIYDELIIDLFLKSGAEEITIGGSIKDPAPDFWIDVDFMQNIRVERSLDEIREAYANLAELTQMFDTRNDKFSEIKEKLKKIGRTTRFDLENSGIKGRILDNDEVKEIATRSPDLWTQVILAMMYDMSPAWGAAQEIHLVADGNEGLLGSIKNRIAGSPKRGFNDWYLLKAFQWFDRGVFDAEEFFEKYYRLFRPGEGVQEAQERREREDLAPITEDEYPELSIPNLDATVPSGALQDKVDDGRIGEETEGENVGGNEPKVTEEEKEEEFVSEEEQFEDIVVFRDNEEDLEVVITKTNGRFEVVEKVGGFIETEVQENIEELDKAREIAEQHAEKVEEEIEDEEDVEEEAMELAMEELKKEIIATVEDLEEESDDGSAGFKELVERIQDRFGASEDTLEEAINDLLSVGAMYEPRPGALKVLEPPARFQEEEEKDIPEPEPVEKEEEQVEQDEESEEDTSESFGLHEKF